ncbi:hypothetical protein FB451DRAFT_1238051 [Mycena latifolia]|nr:hypothetical protein FB451DRAFT_1238051 [Mycena latifolia]
MDTPPISTFPNSSWGQGLVPPADGTEYAPFGLQVAIALSTVSVLLSFVLPAYSYAFLGTIVGFLVAMVVGAFSTIRPALLPALRTYFGITTDSFGFAALGLEVAVALACFAALAAVWVCACLLAVFMELGSGTITDVLQLDKELAEDKRKLEKRRPLTEAEANQLKEIYNAVDPLYEEWERDPVSWYNLRRYWAWCRTVRGAMAKLSGGRSTFLHARFKHDVAARDRHLNLPNSSLLDEDD